MRLPSQGMGFRHSPVPVRGRPSVQPGPAFVDHAGGRRAAGFSRQSGATGGVIPADGEPAMVAITSYIRRENDKFRGTGAVHPAVPDPAGKGRNLRPIRSGRAATAAECRQRSGRVPAPVPAQLVEVVRRADQGPFKAHPSAVSQQELTAATGLLDLSEHRFDRDHAQPLAVVVPRVSGEASSRTAQEQDLGNRPPNASRWHQLESLIVRDLDAGPAVAPLNRPVISPILGDIADEPVNHEPTPQLAVPEERMKTMKAETESALDRLQADMFNQKIWLLVLIFDAVVTSVVLGLAFSG